MKQACSPTCLRRLASIPLATLWLPNDHRTKHGWVEGAPVRVFTGLGEGVLEPCTRIEDR